MPKKKQPTARTLEWCRRRGYLAGVVERRLTFKVKIDLFGFGDILYVSDKPGSTIAQVTSHQHVGERVTKILTDCAEAAQRWLAAGNRIEVHGWQKKGERWVVRVVAVELDSPPRPPSATGPEEAGRGKCSA